MKDKKRASICALVGVLAATAISGCHVNAHYRSRYLNAHFRIDTPGPEDGIERKHKHRHVYRTKPINNGFPIKECIQYATSYAESMKKNGKRLLLWLQELQLVRRY